MYGNLNAILAKVVGVVNASSLTLPAGAVSSLPPALQALAARVPGRATAALPIIDVGGGAAPGTASVLGLQAAGSTAHATLSAQPGDGQVLGNLLFNVASGGGSPLVRLLDALFGTGRAAPARKLLKFNLPSLDLNVLGLEVTTSPVAVTVSAQIGQGQMLGNVLTAMPALLGHGTAHRLNAATTAAASLLGAGSLSVNGINSSGPFATAPVDTAPVASLSVPAEHADVLGAIVDVGTVRVDLVAHSGDGLVLGNALSSAAHLFDPPLPSSVNLNDVNARLQQVLDGLNAQAPGIAPAATTPAGAQPVVAAGVPGLNLNLLGLSLQTAPVAIDAEAQSGNGLLLGNVLTTLANTMGQTPQQEAALYGKVSDVLAKAVGVFNASTLTVPTAAIAALPPSVAAWASAPVSPGATLSLLDLGAPVIGSIDSLGQQINTAAARLKLVAQTGDGDVLGNLLYNAVSVNNTR